MIYLKRFRNIITAAQTQRGFTMLLAALVASSVLSIGAAAYSIAFKQVKLSAVGRDSQFAFYTADSAAECALYWDFRSDITTGKTFASSINSDASNSLQEITCDQQTVTVYTIQKATTAATSTFYFALPYDDTHGRCAQVTVAKNYNAVSKGVNTLIHADGYSTTVQGNLSTQQTQCGPVSSWSGTYPAPVPSAVSLDGNALQRSVEYKY